jgi:hypothetical protein
MASKVGICNLALSHLGIGKDIANIDTEKSQEAYACRTFYEQALQQTLRDFEWPFATRFVQMTLVEEDPIEGWAFSYRYPSGCLFFRRILSGEKVDTTDTKIDYRIASDSSGQLIFTDQEDAECEYTINANDPNLYPVDFVQALSLRLAYYIAPRITSGDPMQLQNKLAGLYLAELLKAQGNALNEEQNAQLPDAELIRARDS